MKNKIYLLNVFIMSACISLIVWNGIMYIADSGHQISGFHKELLMGGFLFWFVLNVFDTTIKDDDDWAGEF